MAKETQTSIDKKLFMEAMELYKKAHETMMKAFGEADEPEEEEKRVVMTIEKDGTFRTFER